MFVKNSQEMLRNALFNTALQIFPLKDRCEIVAQLFSNTRASHVKNDWFIYR